MTKGPSNTFGVEVTVVDEAGKITYVQLVKEVASEPNYEEVLKAVKGEACGCGHNH